MFELIAMFGLILLLFEPDIMMILFGDISLLLILGVLLKVFVFSNNSKILFVCPFRLSAFLKVYPTFRV